MDEQFKNDFIVLRGTRCYFIDAETLLVRIGTIVGYNNLTHVVTIRVKRSHTKNEYDLIYRTRPYIWFDLEHCLMWLTEFLRNAGLLQIKVMDLSDQLDGSTSILNTTEEIGDKYTIYLNGLRQNREDYVIDDENGILEILISPIPNSHDKLTIEYWKTSSIPE